MITYFELQSTTDMSSLDFYSGSDLLQPVSNYVGLPLDQVNFIACQLFALLFGIFYRVTLKPNQKNIHLRHYVQFTLGIFLLLFCFGRQTYHIFAQSIPCVLLMKYGGSSSGKFVMAFSLLYLCLTHIYRQIYDYGGYTLDITGPLMVNTQRLSSLAFSIIDGTRLKKDESKLSPNIKKHAVMHFPKWYQLSSYLFSFHNVTCGPFCFYNDFIRFVEGSENTVEMEPKVQKGNSSPLVPIIKKLCVAIICAILSMIIVPKFPVDHMLETQFLSKGFVYIMGYVLVCTSLQRVKYYFAWSLADAANNSAGLGISGYDDKGNAKWDLITNVDIRQVEFCTSMKVLLDNWNKTTSYWLRHVVYERVSTSKTLSVFMISAFWHGFYPGYYITFFSGAVVTTVGRLVRRIIRPMFLTSTFNKMLYELITFVCVRFILAYLVVSFVVLQLTPSHLILSSLYYWIHWLAVLFYIVLFIIEKFSGKKNVKS